MRANNLWHQLLLTASYTWSKTTDNASEIFSNGAAGVTSAISQNPLNYTTGEHGLSGLDFPQNFTINFVEQVPAYREQHGLTGRLLGGWAFAGTYFLASGQPYTPIQYNFDYYSSGAYADPTLGVTDYTFNGAYGAGPDDLRPYLGSRSAPATQVGAYAGDVCNYYGGASCGVSPTQLISWNNTNATGDGTVVNVTPANVRYIMNGPVSEAAAGNPFATVARNDGRDAWTNTVTSRSSNRLNCASVSLLRSGSTSPTSSTIPTTSALTPTSKMLASTGPTQVLATPRSPTPAAG